MSKQATVISISVIIAAVIGLVVFRTSSNEVAQQPQATSSQATTTGSGDAITRTVDGVHQYKSDDGRHIVAGTTTVPTPCHQLSTETEIRESDPEKVVISFSAEKENGGGVCAQVVQNRRFKVSFRVSEDANIVGGTFNGDQVKLNLREVGSDEDLDDFQVYTKG